MIKSAVWSFYLFFFFIILQRCGPLDLVLMAERKVHGLQ